MLNFWRSFYIFPQLETKFPIYELSGNDRLCHNECGGMIIMAKKVRRYVSELLEAYEEHTRKSRMEEEKCPEILEEAGI